MPSANVTTFFFKPARLLALTGICYTETTHFALHLVFLHLGEHLSLQSCLQLF